MTDTMNAIAVKPGHLDELAALARNEHRMAKNACANALAHAMNAGDLLIEAKPKVAKGDWETWLEKCSIAASTARLYQQLACHRPEIETAIQGGAELSLRGARSLISKSSRKSYKPEKETLEAHWERASTKARTAFLDAIGVDAVLKHMTDAFARDLCSRIPAGKNKKTNATSKNTKRATLSLTVARPTGSSTLCLLASSSRCVEIHASATCRYSILSCCSPTRVSTPRDTS